MICINLRGVMVLNNSLNPCSESFSSAVKRTVTLLPVDVTV